MSHTHVPHRWPSRVCAALPSFNKPDPYSRIRPSNPEWVRFALNTHHRKRTHKYLALSFAYLENRKRTGEGIMSIRANTPQKTESTFHT